MGLENSVSMYEPVTDEPIIEVKKINKTFKVNGNEVTVFDDVSYKIQKGSFLSIVGPSGCGKSTLLKLISGLELPTKGKILFKNQEITGPPKGMIYVFQQYSKSIFPWRTVLQNIEFGLNIHRKLSRKESRETCMRYIRLVGLEGYEDYYPSQLSGGMQQRVVIARALICEPEVILMDEPFSAVDAMTRAILQELLLKIWESLDITILFVTHDIDEAVYLSNQIISLGKSPASIKEDIQINLPYPRDQIKTKEEERFINIRNRLFSSIFKEEIK